MRSGRRSKEEHQEKGLFRWTIHMGRRFSLGIHGRIGAAAHDNEQEKFQPLAEEVKQDQEEGPILLSEAMIEAEHLLCNMQPH